MIPFTERAECLHKESCKFKPFCIFYHPEGQGVLNAQNVSKLCRFTAKGESCPRTHCTFNHTIPTKTQDFQKEHLVNPPPLKIPEMAAPNVVRVSVIVMNQKKERSMLSQQMTSLNLKQ